MRQKSPDAYPHRDGQAVRRRDASPHRLPGRGWICFLLLVGISFSLSCYSSRPRIKEEWISKVTRSPAMYLNQGVLLHGVAVELVAEPRRSEGVRGVYRLKDESGKTIAVWTYRLPVQGRHYEVAGVVGQSPDNALEPILLEYRRVAPERDALLVLLLVLLLLGSVPLALFLASRRREAGKPVPGPEAEASIAAGGEPQTARRGGALRLEITSGADAGQAFVYDKDRITVGRSGLRSNDLTLSDETVSRNQAVIYRDQRLKSFVVRNEGRTNPLKINGRPMEEVALEDGDLLTVGRTAIRVRYVPSLTNGQTGQTEEYRKTSQERPFGSASILLFLCFGIAGGMGTGLQAADEVTIALKRLDLTGLPDVSCTFQVQNRWGRDQLDLGADDFRVSLDGDTVEQFQISRLPGDMTAAPDLVLLCETSAETRGRPWFLLKEATGDLLARTLQGTRFALVTHDDQARLDLDFTTSSDEVLRRLGAVQHRGGTRGYYEGLEKCCGLLERVGRNRAAVIYFCRPGIFTRADMRSDLPKRLKDFPECAIYPVILPERDGARTGAYLRSLHQKLTRGLTGHYTLVFRSPDGEDNRIHTLRVEHAEAATAGGRCRYKAVTGTGIEPGQVAVRLGRLIPYRLWVGCLIGAVAGFFVFRTLRSRRIRRTPDRPGGGAAWCLYFVFVGSASGFLLLLLFELIS